MTSACLATCAGTCPGRDRHLDCLGGRPCWHTAHLSGAGESHRWLLEIVGHRRHLRLHLDPTGTLYAAITLREEA